MSILYIQLSECDWYWGAVMQLHLGIESSWIARRSDHLRELTSHHYSSKEMPRGSAPTSWMIWVTLHQSYAAQINRVKVESQPHCQAQGRPIVIIKDSDKGIEPSKYCSTCKLLSGIRVLKLKRHVCQYMSIAQRGIANNTRGPGHQLLKTEPSLEQMNLNAG